MEKTRLKITGSSKDSVWHEVIWFGYDMSHYITQADLELAVCSSLVSNRLRLSCLNQVLDDIYILLRLAAQGLQCVILGDDTGEAKESGGPSEPQESLLFPYCTIIFPHLVPGKQFPRRGWGAFS